MLARSLPLLSPAAGVLLEQCHDHRFFARRGRREGSEVNGEGGGHARFEILLS